MPPLPTDPQEPEQIEIGSLVEVVDTDDEWEGIVGIVESFYTRDNCPLEGSPQDSGRELAVRAGIFIPTSKTDIAAHRFDGVNFMTAEVRLQLVRHDSIHLFDIKNLAIADI